MSLLSLGKFWRTLPASQRGMMIILIPIACLLSSVGVLVWLDQSMAEHQHWVEHTQKVRLETSALLKNLVDAETGVRGYGLTRRPEFLQPYHIAIVQIPSSLADLQQLVRDNPPQVARLRAIEALITENLALLEDKLLLKQQLNQPLITNPLLAEDPASTENLYLWLQEGKETMDQTRQAIDTFALEEERLLSDRQQRLELYHRVNSLMLILSVLVGVTSGGFAIHLFLQLHRELASREERLQTTNIELAQAYDRLERFTANASHELRAPISAVLSNAQVGLMAIDHDQPRQRLEKIVRLAKSMSSLVNDLLFLARHENITDKRSLHSFDLRAALSTTSTSATCPSPLPYPSQEWQTQNHDPVQLDYELPNHPVIIRGDVDLIQQVIANLLSNAYRHTPPGGQITVSLQTINDRATIEVADTGIGISPEALPYIFERFYREDHARSKATGGFGLGLAIVQQIVQAHQGRIDVTSEVGKGSRFRVSLPVASTEQKS